MVDRVRDCLLDSVVAVGWGRVSYGQQERCYVRGKDGGLIGYVLCGMITQAEAVTI